MFLMRVKETCPFSRKLQNKHNVSDMTQGYLQGPPHSMQIVSPAFRGSATKQDKFRKNADSLIVNLPEFL